MLTDDAIAHEVATYNELIPGTGELSGTLFIELVDDARLRNWLPRLVGIECAVHFELPVRHAVALEQPDRDGSRNHDDRASAPSSLCVATGARDDRAGIQTL